MHSPFLILAGGQLPPASLRPLFLAVTRVLSFSRASSALLLIGVGLLLLGGSAPSLDAATHAEEVVAMAASGDTPRSLSGGLTLGSDGNLYGVSAQGGAYNFGTVFKLTSDGTLTTLVDFTNTGATNRGGAPRAALTEGSPGVFYGTTQTGGVSNFGTVFQVTSAGVLTTLAEFTGVSGAVRGENSYAPLTLGSDGDFYGVTAAGGNASSWGTLFKVSTAGVFTNLVLFTNNGATNKGWHPIGQLIQGSDGDFYGTSQGGGTPDKGTVFKVTSAGALTTLFEFSTGGAGPNAGLTLGNDGNFYGTTYGGGSPSGGTVFKMTSVGALTNLVEFGALPTSSGRGLSARLVLGGDGNFYGTTSQGGISDQGTVFRVTSDGVLTTLVQFTSNGAINKGKFPTTGLTLGADGYFYGTTLQGGSLGGGTIFRLVGEATATAVSALPDPSTSGDSVTFTATVTATNTPTGTVTFKEGATTLGSGTLSGGVATFSTSVLTAGSHTITAEYAGPVIDFSASSGSTSVTVKDPQTINFGTLTPVNLGSTSTFELAATTTSGLPITYASPDTSVVTISGTTVTIVGIGMATITATQAGNGSYLAADPVAQVLTVNPRLQTIAFPAIGDVPAGTVRTLAATTSSGLPVTYTLDSGSATLAGDTITFTTPGYVTIRAHQAGDALYLAAPDVLQTVQVKSANGGGGSVAGSEIYLPLSSVTVDSGGEFVLLSVRRNEGGSETISVDYHTVDGTALAGVDYTVTSGTLTFATGVTEQAITVPILAGANPGRLFTLELSNPAGATVRAPGSMSVTITGTPPLPIYQAYALYEYQLAGSYFAAGDVSKAYLAYAYYFYFLYLDDGSVAHLNQFYENLAIVYFVNYRDGGDLPSAYAWYDYVRSFAVAA